MTERAERAEELFDRHGFPGYDTVGEVATEAFWLIVQHADHDPEFQQRVIEAMEPAVASGNASGRNLAYLTDRVLINTGRPQRYGTQVQYEHAIGRAYPKELEDAAAVDHRRAAVGLEPLWEYMNDMSGLYYRMNTALLNARGIEAPYRYDNSFTAW